MHQNASEYFRILQTSHVYSLFRLRIANSQTFDTGTYKCEGYNIFGKASTRGVLYISPGMYEVHICTTSVHICTTSVHICTTSVHICTTSVHICTTSLHIYTTSVHICTTSVHIYTTLVYICTTSVHICTTHKDAILCSRV